MVIRHPVQPAVHRARQHLQYPLPRDRLAVLAPNAAPNVRRVVDHIADPIQTRQCIVQLLQRLARALLVANLEELDAHLAQRRIQGLEPPRRIHNHALGIVRRLAVRQHNDVQRLRVLAVAGFARSGIPVEMAPQDAVETRGDRRYAAGLHEVEQAPDLVRGTHVARRVLGRVEEEHVDAVGVVFGGDGGDGLERGAGVAPPRELVHAGRVVDHEDGVEGAQEVVLVFAQRAPGAAGLRGGEGGRRRERRRELRRERRRRIQRAIATPDLDGLRLGAELGTAGARVEGRPVAVQEGVVLRHADGHLGHGVGNVLVTVA